MTARLLAPSPSRCRIRYRYGVDFFADRAAVIVGGATDESREGGHHVAAVREGGRGMCSDASEADFLANPFQHLDLLLDARVRDMVGCQGFVRGDVDLCKGELFSRCGAARKWRCVRPDSSAMYKAVHKS